MALTLEKLPAERGTIAAPIAAAGGCCCCCCCCLHTVGSVVGALSAKPVVDEIALITAPPTAVAGAEGAAPKYTITREYWLTTLLLCTVAFPLIFLRDEDVHAGAMMLLFSMILPGVQLAASVVTVGITMASKRPGREERLRHLGRITLRAFIGTCIGLLIMLPMLSIF